MTKTTDTILGTNLIAMGMHLLDEPTQLKLEKLLNESDVLDRTVYELAKTQDFESFIERAFRTATPVSQISVVSSAAKIQEPKIAEPEPEPAVSFASFF